MLSVLVQVWGPANAMFGGYDWITAGIIENPESLDTDFLKQKAIDIINSRFPEDASGVSSFRPFMNAARLKIVRDNRTEMKVTLTDLW
ncbi:MAG: hypothetical protein HY517_03835 [Candidatus Aenigmarchaeota archaeon]|nr:hypothetical protein [Candidatus Aenigmarchaeota archaeon]